MDQIPEDLHPVKAGLISILRLVEEEASRRTKERSIRALPSLDACHIEESVIDIASLVLEEMQGEIERMFRIRRLLQEEDEG